MIKSHFVRYLNFFLLILLFIPLQLMCFGSISFSGYGTSNERKMYLKMFVSFVLLSL